MTSAPQGMFRPAPEVKATVYVPPESDLAVQLVRKDHLETANEYRVCFEIALGLTCAIVGAILPTYFQDNVKVSPYLWLMLGVFGLATVAFLLLYFKHQPKPLMPEQKT